MRNSPKKKTVSGGHVTLKEADRVLNFLVAMNSLLSLPAYTYVVMEKPCGPEHEASIEPVGRRWAARVELGVEWMDRDEWDRMKTLVHEVCHLTHREVDEVFEETRHFMHDYEHAAIGRSWDRNVELMVDHWAQILSEVPAVREAWLNA